MEEILMKEHHNSQEKIDLFQIFKVFSKKNIRFIMIATFCMSLLLTLYTVFFIPKKYKSESTIFLAPKINESGIIDQGSINSNASLINTYISIIKGDSMLTGVVETIGNNLSVEYIKSTLSVSNDSGTQIIRIGSITTDPELSKDIVETIVNQFSSEMMEKLNIQNINVVDYAKINENPVSPNIVKNAIIGAFIGFIISTSYVYLSYLLDNRLRNKNDAEKYLGIPVLAEIPWFEE